MTSKSFLTATPPDLSGWPGYVEYVYYDGPLMFTVGNRHKRYFFQAIPDDEKSKALNTLVYLVTPMTMKREQDIVDNKLTLHQAVLHSGGLSFKTYDHGTTFEEVVLTRTEVAENVCSKGVRFSGDHPAWIRRCEKRRAKRLKRDRSRAAKHFRNRTYIDIDGLRFYVGKRDPNQTLMPLIGPGGVQVRVRQK